MLAPRTMDGFLNLATLAREAIPPFAREMARLSLFDWFAVARAGAQEPVAKSTRSSFAATSRGLPSDSPAQAKLSA